jgi:hypothetical protein
VGIKRHHYPVSGSVLIVLDLADKIALDCKRLDHPRS